MDTSHLEPRVEPLTSDSDGIWELARVIEQEQVRILLDLGSEIRSTTEGLAAEYQEKVSSIESTRDFVGQAKVRTAFGQEHTSITQTVPFTVTIDTAGGVVQFEVPLILLHGERNLSL